MLISLALLVIAKKSEPGLFNPVLMAFSMRRPQWIECLETEDLGVVMQFVLLSVVIRWVSANTQEVLSWSQL